MKNPLALASVVCCAPGSPPLPKRDRERLASQFKALGDPTRVGIVNQIAERGEVCVCHFDALGLSQPTVSHHLKVLREAGLVTATRRGTWMFYRLVPETMRSLAFALGGAPEPELVLATADRSVVV
jgi:ArsR family transcriptional regulator